ncbi:MAG TPA: transglycosylase SLT domain-containing protein [Thermoanaerobaculia bacterium]|jgi:soluble lytic murein transglycosylase|nr:transglycosylase SLT domain-containing protein [Thermoanaerobaculia bacterium]
MFGAFTLVLAATVADPRPELVELQLAGKPQQALVRVEEELAQRPEAARGMGLSYLRGHLLDALGRIQEAGEAFVAAMTETPALRLYSRYRMAVDLDRTGHPEVAAGLVATVAGGNPSSPLIPEAVRLLTHAIAEGGECRLLRGLRAEAMPAPQRREIQLAQGDCALRGGYRDFARSLFVKLIEEDRSDETALGAAERLASMVSEAERGRLPMLIGFTFQAHREFGRALRHLQRAKGRGDALSARDAYETQLMIGQSMLADQRYAEASLAFSSLAVLARTPAERARAYYYEGRAHELRGAWPAASSRFRAAYQAEPLGMSWAAPALLAALRIEWRNGAEATALSYYQRLTSRPEWRGEAARAALFLAASDITRGRRDRARPWLAQAVLGTRDDRLEASYWSGRLAESEKDEREAVQRYADVLRADPYHPLARSARARLASEPLARAAAAEGRRLAASPIATDVYGAWLLLGNDPAGRAALRRLEQMLLADRSAAPYMKLAEVPVRRWPMWDEDLDGPEEMLLALGVWNDGAQAVRDHFPLSDPSLAFTGGLLLARGGEISRSITVAEALRSRAPDRLPLALQPRAFRRLLYPFPYQSHIIAQGRMRGVDPDLLTSLLRVESRFDVSALYPTANRGLTRLPPSTARSLAVQLNLGQRAPEILYRPEVSIALAAAYLSTLLRDFGGAQIPAVAAYEAGEAQAMVWRNLCFTDEPEELFTKIGERATRDYVRRVLTGQRVYAELY